MGMFDNFNDIKAPNNLHLFLDRDFEYEIVIGANCRHTFKLNCRYSDTVLSSSILYTQGDFNILIPITQSMVEEISDTESLIKVILSPAATYGFKINGLSAKCQLQLTLKTTNYIAYTDWYNIKLYSGIQNFNESDRLSHKLNPKTPIIKYNIEQNILATVVRDFNNFYKMSPFEHNNFVAFDSTKQQYGGENQGFRVILSIPKDTEPKVEVVHKSGIIETVSPSKSLTVVSDNFWLVNIEDIVEDITVNITLTAI